MAATEGGAERRIGTGRRGWSGGLEWTGKYAYGHDVGCGDRVTGVKSLPVWRFTDVNLVSGVSVSKGLILCD